MPKPKQRKPTKFAHRALQSNNRRPLPAPLVNTVEQDLKFYQRPLAYSSALELDENLALVGWAVRLVLGYTASFKFQAKTGNPDTDRLLEAHVAERTRARYCDRQRQASLWQMIRAYGGLRILYGTSAILKLQGGLLQQIEAWQIAKGKNAPKEVNDIGLVMDADGLAVEKYALNKGPSSAALEFAQLVGWQDLILDRYGMRPSAQLGVSPLLPAIETARYYMTASEFYWFKIKIASMFGVVIYSDDNTSGPQGFQYNTATTPPTDAPKTTPIKYDLRPGLKLQLTKDSRAEFIESKSPPAEFLAYAKHSIRLILASLNIPYSLWDSEESNYSAMRGDFNLFKQSILEERDKNQQAGHDALEHLLQYDDAARRLPGGLRYADVDWELVPTANFVLDLSKEVDAITKKIAIGACTYDDAARELGGLRSFDETVRMQGDELKRAAAAGVPLTRGVNPGAAVAEPAPTNKE